MKTPSIPPRRTPANLLLAILITKYILYLNNKRSYKTPQVVLIFVEMSNLNVHAEKTSVYKSIIVSDFECIWRNTRLGAFNYIFQ